MFPRGGPPDHKDLKVSYWTQAKTALGKSLDCASEMTNLSLIFHRGRPQNMELHTLVLVFKVHHDGDLSTLAVWHGAFNTFVPQGEDIQAGHKNCCAQLATEPALH